MCNSHKQKDSLWTSMDVSSAREVGFVIKMGPFSECDTNLETAAAIENKDADMEVDIVPDSRDTAAGREDGPHAVHSATQNKSQQLGQVHTGKRPFACFECGATFEQVKHLKR